MADADPSAPGPAPCPMKDGFTREASDLLEEVTRLRASVAADGKATFKGWRPQLERRPFAMSALNLAHYLAFRSRDLRPLQRRLMALGLSSLGRAERPRACHPRQRNRGSCRASRRTRHRSACRALRPILPRRGAAQEEHRYRCSDRRRRAGWAASSSPLRPKRQKTRTSSFASPSTAPMRCASIAPMTTRSVGAR